MIRSGRRREIWQDAYKFTKHPTLANVLERQEQEESRASDVLQGIHEEETREEFGGTYDPHDFVLDESLKEPLKSVETNRRYLSNEIATISNVVGDETWFDKNADPEDVKLPASIATFKKRFDYIPEAFNSGTETEMVRRLLTSAKKRRTMIRDTKKQIATQTIDALREIHEARTSMSPDDFNAWNSERETGNRPYFSGYKDFVVPIAPGTDATIPTYGVSALLTKDWG